MTAPETRHPAAGATGVATSPPVRLVRSHGTGAHAAFTLDSRGAAHAAHEDDERVAAVVAAVLAVDGTVPAAPNCDDALLDATLARIHDQDYLEHLRAHDRRGVSGHQAVVTAWSAPGVVQDTPLYVGAWSSAREGARAAISAADLVAGGGVSFAACRPPGHHAGPRWFGGYCFLNTASAAAAHLAARGLRPAVLDIDFHFGNGTDAILRRLGVPFASIHASTERHFPWYAVNSSDLIVTAETPVEAQAYVNTTRAVLDRLVGQGADALVVSVGFDILAGDPHGGWNLEPAIFVNIGAALAAPGLPLCLVQEGGYDIGNLSAGAGALAAALVHAEAV